MKLVIVSGLSGSGKSIAFQVLEDLEYYCIDNLPINMLEALTQEIIPLEGTPYLMVAKMDAISPPCIQYLSVKLGPTPPPPSAA